MTETANLGMPFIEGSQAQKHVTHNEALRILDAAIQIGVLDTALTVPPSAPAEGARYIVATGATGDWAGHDNAIAAFEDSAWRFLMPKLGWCAWSAADEVIFVFNGTAWRDLRDLPVALAGTSSVGVNAVAENPNLLTVHSNAALLYAIATADGGSGDARLQISKEGAGDTASVVFSDDFSGRAEFGLVESNAFKLKVSDDGASFIEALAIDQATGNATLSRGVALAGVIAPPQLTGDEDDYAPSGLESTSVIRLSADAVRSISGLADGSEGRVLCLINAGAFAVILRDENPASSAANRFGFGRDLTLGAKQGALLIYDGNAARWRRIGEPSASGGGGATDSERQNALLALVYQSKACAGYRRLVNLFTTGFKGANDAANGIDAGSSNYVVNATAGSVGPTTATLLLSMDGTDGTTIFTDSGPNAHSISASGVTISTSTSKFGGASGNFAGTGGLSFTDNLSDLTFAGDFTVAFWMVTTVTSADTSFRRMFSFNLDSATTLQAYIDGSGFVVVRNSGTLLQGSTNVADGSWHHVEISRVGTTLRLFVDGTQEASITNSTVFAAGATARIGSYNGTSGRYLGYLDDFVVYNGIGLHSSNFTPPSAASHAADSMTLVTASQTADSSVSNGRVLLEFDDSAFPALNTDLAVELTCDGGANWTSATLSLVTSNSQDGRSVAETGDTACTAGTSFAARIKTANGKDVKMHGLSLAVH
jgi:hypothetical protein